MKTFLHIILMIVGMQSLIAQTNTNNNAIAPSTQNPTAAVNTPLIVTNKFNTEYPNTNAFWQTDGENFSASYRDLQTNMQRIIVYDTYGNLVRTDNEVDKGIYPENIDLYYSENYPTEKYIIWASQDTHGNLSYYSVRKSGILLFDKTGNFLTVKNNTVANK
jgi:hypothetical protein